MPDAAPLLADSITKLGPDAAGRVVISGSHGGIYPAWLALTADLRAVILHDAGIGLDRAGTAGLRWAEPLGLAAAAVDHTSAPIGQAGLMLSQGRISEANALARELGVEPQMSCAEAARLLAGASIPTNSAPAFTEAREVLTPPGASRRLVLIDSASLVEPEDAGQVIVSGSHGALFGTDPANALRVDAGFVLFNDAGGQATSRLPLLAERGIAAATVAAASAHIGEARSTYEHGILSACNAIAEAHGLVAGMPARKAVEIMLA